MNWLRRKVSKRAEPQRLTEPTLFPSGQFVDVGEFVYYIKGNTKFKVYSDRVLESWLPAYMPLATPDALSKFLLGPPLGFRNGTLIHNIADGKMYLISDNKRRHITSPDVFDKFGLDRRTMLEVSAAETKLHKEGDPLE